MIWDTEVDISNSSHQEDQGNDNILDGLDGVDLCTQGLFNTCIQHSPPEKGPLTV